MRPRAQPAVIDFHFNFAPFEAQQQGCVDGAQYC